MASDSNHVLHNSANLSFCTVYDIPALTVQNVQDDSETLTHLLEFNDKGPPCVQDKRQDQTPTSPKSIPTFLDYAELRAMNRRMAHKEAKHIHLSEIKEAVSKPAKKAPSNAFHIGFKSANNGLNTTILPLHETTFDRNLTEGCNGQSV